MLELAAPYITKFSSHPSLSLPALLLCLHWLWTTFFLPNDSVQWEVLLI